MRGNKKIYFRRYLPSCITQKDICPHNIHDGAIFRISISKFQGKISVSDGLVGDETVLQVECPLSVYETPTFEQAVAEKKVIILKVRHEIRLFSLQLEIIFFLLKFCDPPGKLKKIHPYYCQNSGTSAKNQGECMFFYNLRQELAPL